MNTRPNPWIESLPIYDPGKYEPAKDANGNILPTIILSGNENALGASPKALQAIRDELQESNQINRYPNSTANDLRHELAAYHNYNAQNIICGAGSDEIIQLLTRCFCSHQDEAIYSQFGFAMYPIAIKATGAQAIKIKENNFTFDVDAVIQAINIRTKLIFIANPNNPTGSLTHTQNMAKLLANLPAHVILVWDAAYAEFVESAEYHQQLKLFAAHPQVIILRTFSKIYGLPSLRIGWAVGGLDVINALNKVRGPFNTSHLAQKAAIAALHDEEFVIKSHYHIIQQRAKLRQDLANLGFNSLESHGNFILVDCQSQEKSRAIHQFCESKNIYLRSMIPYGLHQFIRITIGLESENQAVVQCFAAFKNISD